MAKTKEHWNKIDPEKRNTKNLDYYMRTVVPARPGDERPRDGPEHDLALSSHFEGRHTVVVKSRPLNPLLLILLRMHSIFDSLSFGTCIRATRLCACVGGCVVSSSSSSSLKVVVSVSSRVFFFSRRLLLTTLSLSLSLYKFMSIFPIVFKRGVATNCLGFRV